MRIAQHGPAVHIWRIAFQDMEMRTTSSDGIHVWIARGDVIEALQIPDPAYALESVAAEDQATLSLGTDAPDDESEPDELPLINEIAVYEIMARFPTRPAEAFKAWLMQLRHFYFEIVTHADDGTGDGATTLQ
ncbi:BRO-N domain-containing protein [Acidithiobacillus ferriphilus]|uniref:BRO-N domain-containing protein n=1 Tax=Acidithiobacillus ferriphilus TaxID=1689834 RepID=UPI0023313971|nr:Bro-N domain-containing protein [Acidithiobacillus ferriphilus]WCE92837.1 Bro-N domain-containing protein [Acidithiobacillus ferriphilus]